MTRKTDKTTLGLIVGTRGFFNPRLAQEGRAQLIRQVEALGYDPVILPVKATGHGAVETSAHARACAALFQRHRADIDGIVVSLPNFGDELGVVQTLAEADLRVPVLVQACRDSITAVGVDARRDAFCGKLSVCNNLYQYGIPFTDTSEHTCDLDGALFRADLERFARICRVVRGLRRARIGAVGARPAAFQTVRYSEKLLQRAGITVVPVDLSEILARARRLDDRAAAVGDKLAEIRAYGTIPATIDEGNVLKQAKLSVVLDTWMDENDLDASAIQCWTAVQNHYGCATCLSMSLMGEAHRPSACEVDVTGALSMVGLLLASGHVPGFLDWNNNYGDAPDLCVCTHCSNFPRSFMGADIEISNLDLLGQTLGEDRCFGAIKGHVAPGPLTYFRLSTDDARGTIKGYLGQGEFTNRPFPMDGGIAVCRVPQLRGLLRHLCRQGFEHHVAMVRSHCAGVLAEAVETYLGWELYHHE